jgi:hypothetical protein
VVLKFVRSHSFTNETEHKVVDLLNTEGEKSGRKVNRGSFFGEKGSMSVTFHDDFVLGTADARRLALEELHKQGTEMYLRDPFGGVKKVWLESVDYDRIEGLGSMASTEIDITYVEVL